MTRNQLQLLLRVTRAIQLLIPKAGLDPKLEEELLLENDAAEQEVRHQAGLSTHVDDEGPDGQTTQADGGAGPGDTQTA